MAFWKKPKEEEEIDEKEKEQISLEINNSKHSNSNHSGPLLHESEVRIDRLEIEIERIKALLSTSSEYRKVTDEKFTRINESIGELRTSIIEREKQVKDLEIAALKSADLVKEVQPEKLLSEIKKTEAKSEILHGKLESYDQLISNIIDEIKSIRKVTLEFEGLESIEEISKELRSELAEIRKRETVVEIESSKVGKIFQEIQKRYQDQQEINSLISQSIITDTELKKQIDAINIRLSSLLDKEELVKLKSEIKGLLSGTGVRHETNLFKKAIGKISAHSSSATLQIPEPEIASQDKAQYEISSSESISRLQYDNIKASMRELEKSLLSRINDETIKTKESLKGFEHSLSSFKQNPENPLYQKLKQDIYTKLAYYDTFLSDTATKLPSLEKDLSAFKQHLNAIIIKNQEIVQYLKGKEILKINSSELLTKDSLQTMQDNINDLKSRINELNDYLKVIEMESSKKYHELIYAVNEKQDKSAGEDSLKSVIYITNKKVNELKMILDNLPASNTEEIKSLITEMNKKMNTLSYELSEKQSSSQSREANENINSGIGQLNKKVAELRYILNEKEDKTNLQEVKEKFESKIKEQEAMLTFLQDGLTSLYDVIEKKELPQIKNEIAKLKSLINDIIRRDEQWISSIFKTMEK